MENTTNSPETTGAEQTKSLDSLLDQAVDGENVLGGGFVVKEREYRKNSHGHNGGGG
jgi:hypothetical protein